MGPNSVRRTAIRGIFHTVIGLAVVAVLLLLPHFAVVAVLAIATAIFLSFELARLRISVINKWFLRWFGFLTRDEENNRLTGSSYALVGFLITVLAFDRDIAILAILYLSFGDSAATIIGVWKGRSRLWGRSIEGDIACLVICIAAGLTAASLLNSPTLPVAITGAVFATIFQALPLRLNDNLTIPIGSGLAMLAASAII